MGHVQFILDSRKKAQTVTPSVPITAGDHDLQGFHRTEQMRLDLIATRKKEYSFTLRQVRELDKKAKSLKGEERNQTKMRIEALKDHMATLLSGIGKYTDDERLYGFEEVRNEH